MGVVQNNLRLNFCAVFLRMSFKDESSVSRHIPEASQYFFPLTYCPHIPRRIPEHWGVHFQECNIVTRSLAWVWRVDIFLLIFRGRSKVRPRCMNDCMIFRQSVHNYRKARLKYAIFQDTIDHFGAGLFPPSMRVESGTGDIRNVPHLGKDFVIRNCNGDRLLLCILNRVLRPVVKRSTTTVHPRFSLKFQDSLAELSVWISAWISVELRICKRISARTVRPGLQDSGMEKYLSPKLPAEIHVYYLNNNLQYSPFFIFFNIIWNH